MKKRNFILLLIILFCLITRLLNFVGVGINDDIGYIQNARALVKGYNLLSPKSLNQIGSRLGMVLPLALLYKIFGYNEIGFTLYPLFCSLITCSLIYFASLKLWGRSSAIFASLLWATYPLQIVFDTQLSPSDQHATCVIAAFFFYFYAITEGENDSSRWKKILFLILSGIFIGLGWWVNELFVTFIFIILPFLIIMRPQIRNLLFVFIGFSSIMFIELLMFKISSGSWFAKIFCILQTEEEVLSNKEFLYLPKVLFKIINIDPSPLSGEGHFGIIWYLFIFITILTLFLKDKLSLSFALGCWFWLFYLQWGIQSPEGTPIARYTRYISMIVPLQCLTFGGVLQRFFLISKKFRRVVISLFFLLLIHLFFVGRTAAKGAKINTEDFREITKVLLSLGIKKDEPIYTDDLTANFIELYSKESLFVTHLNNSKIIEPPERGIIIKNGSWYCLKLEEYRNTLPKWFLAPPENHWELIHIVKGEKVWFYKDFDPEIYRILPKKTERREK
ncbi:MAG: glycosyltransferase family 39 protein [candidate division WOR-3 bacterium]